jgi:hypothetical protein
MNLRLGAIVFVMLSILLTAEAGAQNDFARSHGEFLTGAIQPKPNFQLDASYQPNVGIEDSDVADAADLVHVKTRLGRGFVVNKDVAILTAFNYSLRNYSSDESDVEEDLHELAIELGVSWFVRDNFLVSATFRPGIFSDLDKSIDGNDFLPQGNIIGIYQWSESFFLKFGVAAGVEFFEETSVIPVGGFTWVSSDQLRVDVFLPASATVTWQPSEKHSLLVVPGIHLQGQRYRVNIGSNEGYIQIQDIRADVTASYEVSDGARVSLVIGANIRGKYEVEVEDVVDADFEQDPSLYFGIGFGAFF